MEAQVNRTNILGTESIPKLLKMFAWPTIISMVANSLYNIIDQVFIGHAVGYLGIAATTISFPVVSIVLAAGTLVGVGGSALAAIKLGEGRREEAEEILNTATVVAALIGLVLAVLGNVFLEQVLTIFGATAATMEYSKQFGGIMITIMPMTMLLVVLSNLARTDGSPLLAMHSLVGGVIVNALLAPVFIFVFGWGVRGAALATTAAQVFSLITLVWYFTKRSNMRLTKEKLQQPHWELLRAAMAIGASSCLLQLSATVLQIALNNTLLYYGDLTSVGGDAAISALGIVLKVNMVYISICIGIGAGAQPIIGFNRGAEQYDRVLETYKLAAKIASIVTLLGWLMCQLVPKHILILFGLTEGEAFMDFAVDCMRIFLGGVFLAGFQITSTSYFQATGQPTKACILSLMRQFIVLLPLVLILPRWFGLYGVLYAGLIADFVSCAVVFFFIRHEIQRLQQHLH